MRKLQIAPKHINQLIAADYSCEEKEKLFRQALIDFPENEVGILWLFTIILGYVDKYEERISICDKLLLALDDNIEISDVYYRQAESYLELKDTDKAIELFTKSYEIYSDLEAPVLEMVDIYKEREDWDNVIKMYDLIKDEFYDREKYFDLGLAYANKKEYEQAKDCYTKYLEIDSDNIIAIYNLGAMLGELGDIDSAIELFKKGLLIDPNDSEFYYNLGTSYSAKGDYYMAMHYYLEALKINPDYPAVYNNMGAMTFNDEGDGVKAIEYLEKAIELSKEGDPIKGTLYMSLITINTKLTNFERADYYRIKVLNLLGYDAHYEEREVDDDEEDED